MFFKSWSSEEPQDFHDEIFNILYAMGVTSIKMVMLVAYKLKDVKKNGTHNGEIIGH